MSRAEDQYGWGVGSWTMFLVVVACLIFLPLGMGPGPVGPPSIPVLLLFPIVLAAIVLYLFIASS